MLSQGVEDEETNYSCRLFQFVGDNFISKKSSSNSSLSSTGVSNLCLIFSFCFTVSAALLGVNSFIFLLKKNQVTSLQSTVSDNLVSKIVIVLYPHYSTVTSAVL